MHFKDEAEFFGKERGYRIGAGLKIDLNTAVACKSHFQKRGDEAAVAAVVSRGDIIFCDAGLECANCAFEQGGIIYIWRLVAELLVHMGERRPTEAMFVRTEIDVKYDAFIGMF